MYILKAPACALAGRSRDPGGCSGSRTEGCADWWPAGDRRWGRHPSKRRIWLAHTLTCDYMHLKPRDSSLMCVVFFRNSVRCLRVDEKAAGGDFGLHGRHRAERSERPGQAETTQCSLTGSVLAATNWYLIFRETLSPQETLSQPHPVYYSPLINSFIWTVFIWQMLNLHLLRPEWRSTSKILSKP